MKIFFTKVFLLLLLFFASNPSIAQNSEISDSIPDYIMHWGQISTPFGKNYQKIGEKPPPPLPISKILIHEFITSLKEQVFFYENGQPASSINSILFLFRAPTKKENWSEKEKELKREAIQQKRKDNRFSIELNNKNFFSEESIQKILRLTKHKTIVTIYLNSYDFGCHLHIIDPYGAYEAPVEINQSHAELFDFQILELKNGKSLLKIDTTKEKNQRVFNIYKKNKKFEIIHLSNFRTASRIVSQKEENDITSVLSSTYKFPPNHYIKIAEYAVTKPEELTLIWGELTANPESKNYPLKIFQENISKKIKLYHQQKKLEIKAARITLFNKNKEHKTFVSAPLKSKNLKKNLVNLSYENSIYFDEIIIETDGQEYYLPQVFVFKIGKVHLKN